MLIPLKHLGLPQLAHSDINIKSSQGCKRELLNCLECLNTEQQLHLHEPNSDVPAFLIWPHLTDSEEL
jgi:hypothetical protein